MADNVTEVYINDERVDLVPGQAVAMTYQLSDIADIKNQRANFSNQFKVSRSKANDRKLGFASDLNTTDKRPYRMLPARILIDGEDIVENGYAVIRGVDTYYSVVIYSGLIDLFTRLGDLKLKDLDLSEYDHILNTTNILSLVNATEGICYPLVDYGHLVFNNTLLSNYMRFSIYAKVLFEKIITDAGFTVSGSFVEHPKYSALLLPFTNDKLTYKADAAGGNFVVSRDSFLVDETGVETTVPFDTVVSGNSLNRYFVDRLVAPDYTVRGKVTVEGTVVKNSGGTVKAIVRLQSSTKLTLAYQVVEIVGAAASFKISIDSTELEAAEQVRFQVRPDTAGGVTIEDATFTYVQDTIVPFNGFCPIAENLPDMKQKDFIKALAQMFGVLYDIDLTTNEVRTRFFDDIVENKARAKDWSNKLDLKDGPPKITFDLGFAQVNEFTYANGDNTGDGDELQDAGQVPADLGNGAVLVDNTNLPAEKNAVSLPFAATEEVLNQIVDTSAALLVPKIKIYSFTNYTRDENPVPPFYSTPTLYAGVANYDAGTIYATGNRVRYEGIVWEFVSSTPASGKTPGITLDGALFTGLQCWKPAKSEDNFILKHSIKVKPRILLAAEAPAGFDTTILSEQGDVVDSVENIIVPYFLSGLDFETVLIPDHYKVYEDSGNDAKLVRANFTLTANDTKELDHLIPVWVGYYANYFYISKIDKYLAGESTGVELVKI